MAAPSPHRLSWRSRSLWLRLGYGATALWMVAILVVTHESPRDPLFGLIVIVPLGGWFVGIAAALVINRLWPPESGGGS